MDCYYEFVAKSNRKDGILVINRDRMQSYSSVSFIDSSKPLTLELEDGRYTDYFFGPDCTNIVSKDLKELLESYASNESQVEFLPINVVSKEYGNRIYYLVHFKGVCDAIDKKISEMLPPGINMLSYYKVRNLDLFCTEPNGFDLIVSERVKKEIKKRKLNSGIEFLPIYCVNIDYLVFCWLSRLDEREVVPEEISALYVGMFETPDGYSLYLTGAVEYDEDDDDWACDQDYEPAEKYLPLPTSEIGEMGWEEFRKEAIAAVSEYIHKFPDSKMFDRIVAAGFDDGDLERIK